MDLRESEDVDNGSQKNRRCGQWILEKEKMWIKKTGTLDVFRKTANMDDANSGSHKILRA